MREVPDEPVDEHVSGTRVEAENLFRLSIRRNHREVGDAADIERHGPAPGVAQKQIIDQRHQRCALAASRHVGGAKIRHAGCAGAFGNDGGFANLQRARNQPAAFAPGRGLMVDCLAVGADRRQPAG